MAQNKNNKKNMKLKQILTTMVIIVLFMGLAYISNNTSYNNGNIINNNEIDNYYNSINEIPDYSGQIYVKINNNIPYFDEKDYTT